ncbi:choice-of-anchor Q domain-containing protein [Dokdonella sp.]|uniref:choice-of-anchor Q domain-containing protein n=1 Tax=Dokdonella sp. TaxID=2291710 RepID=UPI003527712F
MRIALILLALSLSTGADAATINVTTTDDTIAADGQCSLREAITAANTDAAFNGCPAGSGVDQILLAAEDYRLEITGAGEDANASGDLDIRSSLEILGAGADLTRIRGDREDRVLDVGGAGTIATVAGALIRNGAGTLGAGILVAADSSLLLDGCVLTGNATSKGDSGAAGGGIASLGMLTVVDSTFHANDAGTGGGIWTGGAGSTTLRNVTFDSNTSLASGAALSLNAAATLNNLTLSLNLSDNDFNGTGDGALEVNAPVQISNSIVAGNVDFSIIVAGPVNNDCAVGPAGTLTSAGYNLFGVLGNACVLSAAQPGDQGGTPGAPLDPRLQPFDIYGGTVEVFLPMASSPAVEAGSPAASGNPGACEPADARGVLRPQGARCDIGAAELDDLVYRDGFDPPLP